MVIQRPEQRPRNLLFSDVAVAAPVEDWHGYRCLRHEQHHDATDSAGDAGDQLGAHIFLCQERAA